MYYFAHWQDWRNDCLSYFKLISIKIMRKNTDIVMIQMNCCELFLELFFFVMLIYFSFVKSKMISFIVRKKSHELWYISSLVGTLEFGSEGALGGSIPLISSQSLKIPYRSSKALKYNKPDVSLLVLKIFIAYWWIKRYGYR